jgi:uncharacterized protein (DUF488 family)
VGRLFLYPPNPEEGGTLYILGTSTRTSEEFLDLFRKHEIEIGIDIRSFPTSRFRRFIKESLQGILEPEGIHYFAT